MPQHAAIAGPLTRATTIRSMHRTRGVRVPLNQGGQVLKESFRQALAAMIHASFITSPDPAMGRTPCL